MSVSEVAESTVEASRRRRFWLAAAALAFAGGLCPLAAAQAPGPGLPIVVVDAEHTLDWPSSPPYVVPPGEGLVLDVTGYRFPPLDRAEKPPNVVEVAVRSGIYRAEWQASRRIELTARTLTALEDAGPFEGFRRGDRATVTLGFERPIPGTGQTSFEVLWTAFVRVSGAEE